MEVVVAQELLPVLRVRWVRRVAPSLEQGLEAQVGRLGDRGCQHRPEVAEDLAEGTVVQGVDLQGVEAEARLRPVEEGEVARLQEEAA